MYTGVCWKVTINKTDNPQSNKMQKKITEGAKSWGEVMCMKA